MIRTGLFKYVPHAQADEHMKAGWLFVRDLGPTHGTYSALFWHCGCGRVDAHMGKKPEFADVQAE